MSYLPRIRRSFSVVVHNPDLVEIRSGVWNVCAHILEDEEKSGKLFEIVNRLLDGQLSANQIAAAVKTDRSTVEGVIDQLTSLGAIETKPSSAYDRYLEEMGYLFQRPRAEKKSHRPVLLFGSSHLTDEIHQKLEESVGEESIQKLDLVQLLDKQSDWTESGIDFERQLAKFEPYKDFFWVLVQDSVDPITTNRLNRIAFALNVPWLHVAIDGPFILVGPLFKGGEGPCYQCFETRITMNLRERENYQRYKYALAKSQIYQGKSSRFPVLDSLAASLAVMEILNFSFTDCSHVWKKVLSIFIPTMEIAFNDLLQLSSCDVCGTVQQRDKKQLYFDIDTLLK